MDNYCKSCGAKIVWRRTIKGRMMPCDPDFISICPNTTGKVVSGLNSQGELVMGVIATGDEQEDTLVIPVQASHFATCPEANKWRKGT